MKVFIISHKMPYPPKDGGSFVTLNFAKALADFGCDITILAMNTYKRRFDIDRIPDELKKKIKFFSVDVDTKIKTAPFILNLMQRESYHIWRYGTSKEFKEALIELLKNENWDIVQLEGLYLSPYVETIRRYSNAKIVMRAHNVEYEILERYAEYEKSFLKKIWLKNQAKRLKHYELERLRLYDAIISVTEKDAEILKVEDVPTLVIPAGIEIENDEPDFSETEFPSLFYIGALDWFPNQQGLEWFFENVWNEVIKNMPGLKLYIAGRNPQMWKYLKGKRLKNVEIVGEVESSREFIKSKAIMIVPLLAGSGIRVKIIEAMSLGKAIISTSVGAEGIDYKNGENILISDTKGKFVEEILKCANDFGFCKRIGENAFKLVKERYEIEKLARKLLDFYSKLKI